MDWHPDDDPSVQSDEPPTQHDERSTQDDQANSEDSEHTDRHDGLSHEPRGKPTCHLPPVTEVASARVDSRFDTMLIPPIVIPAHESDDGVVKEAFTTLKTERPRFVRASSSSSHLVGDGMLTKRQETTARGKDSPKSSQSQLTFRALATNQPLVNLIRISTSRAQVTESKASAQSEIDQDALNSMIYSPKSAHNERGKDWQSRINLKDWVNPSSLFQSHSRVYPTTYTPDRQGIDNEDEHDRRHSSRSESVRKSQYHSGKNQDENQSHGIVGEALHLAMHTVQVAALGKSPNPRKLGNHRAVYIKTQRSLVNVFGRPKESKWSSRAYFVIFMLILLNVTTLALATCDGNNFGSSSPEYPMLPSESTYKTLDSVFTLIFTAEIIGRLINRRFSRAIFKDPILWLDVAALSPWYIQEILTSAHVSFDLDSTSGAGHYVAMLRLLRTLRLPVMVRHTDQFKILYLSIKASLRPLGITMFFLFTLVMLLATALFYAEPCYNVNTCEFTDILNSAYFIIVTVSTVGYGNQVPSLTNVGSLGITCVAMIFGQMYFSMPLAIVGTNFQSTYENFQLNTKRKLRIHDSTLSPFDSQDLHTKAHRLCEIHYHFLDSWRIIHLNIIKLLQKCKAIDAHSKEMLEAQAIRHSKIKEGMDRLFEVHAEACQLLQNFIPHKPAPRGAQANSGVSGLFKNRRGAAKDHPEEINTFEMSQTLKGRLWLALEAPDSSRFANGLNMTLVVFAVLSIFLFCCESLRELSSSGITTTACRTVVSSYCSESGFENADPGCFARSDLTGLTNYTQQLDFTCSSALVAPDCYGYGLNFGSANASALSCANAFLESGVNLICYRQQCTEGYTFVNMEPYWIYFEWFFGIIFTAEFMLRFFVAHDRLQLLTDGYMLFDILAVVPFFVEVAQYAILNVQPSYAVVATAPSFLSVIRVLKTMRILKLTRHFRGTKVLTNTAKEVWRQLMIPIFFLFNGCVIAAAVFYETERGVECFVGTECIWWGKNVLTPEFAAGLPIGKRIMIQDTRLTSITDMLHSTWLSYTTLTSVGYGDLVPRTSFGKFFCITVVLCTTIYSAMPIQLVGSKFYYLYEKHMEKMVVKRGGSSGSWRSKRNLGPEASTAQKKLHLKKVEHNANMPKADTKPTFKLTDQDYEVMHFFISMRRTMMNLQRNLDNLRGVGNDIVSRQNATSNDHLPTLVRKTDGLEQGIEQKSSAILDTLLQYSELVELLQDASPEFEALLDEFMYASPAQEALRSRRSVINASSSLYSRRSVSAQ